MDVYRILAAELVSDLLSDESIDFYKQALLKVDSSKATPRVAAARVAFQKLDSDDQNAICEYFKIVAQDAISTVLGYVDGSQIVPGLEEELSVAYQGQDLSGYLQDSFLQEAEKVDPHQVAR